MHLGTSTTSHLTIRSGAAWSTGHPVEPGQPTKKGGGKPDEVLSPDAPFMSHLGHGSRLGLPKLLAGQTYALCRERVNVFAIQKPGFT